MNNKIKKSFNNWFKPIVIGQAVKFDYFGFQTCKVLREEDFFTIWDLK